MNASRTPARRIVVGLAVAAALATSACAAGQVAGTAEQKTTLDGTNVDVGDIALRGLAIETPGAATFPVGSNLEVKVVIVNNSSASDTLTSISSSVASGWGSYASEDDLTAATSLTPGTTSGQTPGATPTDPATDPSAGVLPSAAPSPSADPRKGVVVQRGLSVGYGVPVANGRVLALTGTKQKLYPGNTVRLTFTFAKAGSRTFTVPIQLSDDGSYTPTPKVLQTSGSSEG